MIPFMAKGNASSGVAFSCHVISSVSLDLQWFFVSSEFFFVFHGVCIFEEDRLFCGMKDPLAVPGMWQAPRKCCQIWAPNVYQARHCIISFISSTALWRTSDMIIPILQMRTRAPGSSGACLGSFSQWEVGQDFNPRTRATNHWAIVSWGIFLVFCWQASFVLTSGILRSGDCCQSPQLWSSQNCPQAPTEIRPFWPLSFPQA